MSGEAVDVFYHLFRRLATGETSARRYLSTSSLSLKVSEEESPVVPCQWLHCEEITEPENLPLGSASFSSTELNVISDQPLTLAPDSSVEPCRPRFRQANNRELLKELVNGIQAVQAKTEAARRRQEEESEMVKTFEAAVRVVRRVRQEKNKESLQVAEKLLEDITTEMTQFRESLSALEELTGAKDHPTVSMSAAASGSNEFSYNVRVCSSIIQHLEELLGLNNGKEGVHSRIKGRPRLNRPKPSL